MVSIGWCSSSLLNDKNSFSLLFPSQLGMTAYNVLGCKFNRWRPFSLTSFTYSKIYEVRRHLSLSCKMRITWYNIEPGKLSIVTLYSILRHENFQLQLENFSLVNISHQLLIFRALANLIVERRHLTCVLETWLCSS